MAAHLSRCLLMLLLLCLECCSSLYTLVTPSTTRTCQPKSMRSAAGNSGAGACSSGAGEQLQQGRYTRGDLSEGLVYLVEGSLHLAPPCPDVAAQGALPPGTEHLSYHLGSRAVTGLDRGPGAMQHGVGDLGNAAWQASTRPLGGLRLMLHRPISTIMRATQHHHAARGSWKHTCCMGQ